MKLTAAALTKLPGIRHGFYTRRGGVSEGIYSSLNCGIGSSDSRDRVLENRARVAADLGVDPDQLATPHQVHSPDVAVVNVVWNAGEGPKADAVATNRSNIAVGVSTADCGPLLLADGKAGVVAAAHAGWKGAFTGVIETTIAAMESLGAERGNIVAVLGPTISRRSYEVGPEFRTRFLDEEPVNERFFVPSDRADHYRFDLPAYIGSRIGKAEIGQFDDLALCTYEDPDRFFSYRRTTHLGEPDYGRLLHAIALTG